MKKITAICIAVMSFTVTLAQETYFKTAPEWSRYANIYEVNIRQYTPEGTINAFAAHLPRLKNMGVDILWVMPVQPIGKKNRKGSLGSYYSIQDYRAVNPEFGSSKDFKNMVKAAHKKDMYVILDWVANHTAFDHEWTKKNKQWYTQDEKGNIIPPVADWSDVADLNYNDQAMRASMIEEMKYWVREMDVDGFRCDVAYMVPADFWIAAIKELQTIKPEIFMLAEGEGPELHACGFDMTYAFEVHHMMGKVHKGEKDVAALDSMIQAQIKAYPEGAYRMQFTSSHDENSWQGTEFERLGQNFQSFFVMAATIPGMPMIYSGQEAGLNKRLRFFDKDTIPFINGVPYENFYGTLLKLKHNNTALDNGLSGGAFTILQAEGNIYAYVRHNAKNKVVVLLNFGSTPAQCKIQSDLVSGSYTNIFTSEKIKLKKEITTEIPAYGFFVWSE